MSNNEIKLVLTSIGPIEMDTRVYDSIKDPNYQKSINSQKQRYSGNLVKL